jgi:probable DNA repair protein
MTDAALFDTTDLEPLLAQGWLALTPNRRLASRIRSAIVRRSAAAGARVVPTPAVLSLADWLDRLWAQLCFVAPDSAGAWLLDEDQERALWDVVVAANAGTLLRPAEAARQAQAAHRMLALWRQLPLRADLVAELEAGEESRLFLGWLAEFERRCMALGAISNVERDRRLLKAVLDGQLQLSASVVTIAFDEMTPLHRALLDALPDWRMLAPPTRNRSIAAIGCDDFATQIRRAAQWARQRLLTEPTATVAIVVPQLAQQRACVERIVRDIFEPDHADPARPHRPPPFNISAGLSLVNVPLVATALQLLRLARRNQSRSELIALLDAPFHLFNEPPDAIAMLIEAICDLRCEQITAAQLRDLTARVTEHFPAWPLSGQLQQLGDLLRRERLLQRRMTTERWRDYFDTLLALFGWPGRRPQDSIEFQQAQQWCGALEDFARLDAIIGEVGFDDALGTLQELLSARLFQPKTADTPLQVLGLLEAAGLQFDALWLCDMGEDQWPPAASPNPLLPRSLQRRLAMPHCDAARELAFAQRLTRSLLAASRDVVVCYQQLSDDVERRISPLFGEPPPLLMPFEANIWPSSLSLLPMERFLPGDAPPVDPAECSSGGSAIVASQSACPFQAFARHRLGARALDEAVDGLDAGERGELLHSALEILWRELGDRETLVNIAVDELPMRADAAACAAVEALRLRIPVRLGERFAALERQRLARLLIGWLELERERPYFTIEALEQTRELTLGGLTLRLRVDRIDRLADGRRLIIDYKSSNALSTSAWTDARPEQPQLPLYGIALEDEQPASVAGLLFAQIRGDRLKLIGLGDAGLEGHGLKVGETPWPQQLADWRIALQVLADEYLQGRAEVAPSSGRSCQRCNLADLCRIGAQGESDDSDDTDREEEVS